MMENILSSKELADLFAKEIDSLGYIRVLDRGIDRSTDGCFIRVANRKGEYLTSVFVDPNKEEQIKIEEYVGTDIKIPKEEEAKTYFKDNILSRLIVAYYRHSIFTISKITENILKESGIENLKWSTSISYVGTTEVGKGLEVLGRKFEFLFYGHDTKFIPEFIYRFNSQYEVMKVEVLDENFDKLIETIKSDIEGIISGLLQPKE